MQKPVFLSILLMLLGFTSPGPSPVSPRELAEHAKITRFRPGQDYALFFAVHKYQNGSLLDLPNTINNAREIARELESDFGFQTKVVENPTLQRIEDEIEAYRLLFQSGRYDSEGQLLIFFAGHGVKEDNTGYFLPADADPDRLYRTALAYDIWRPKISSINCKHILVAVDACYSVTFDPDWRNMAPRRKGEWTETQKALENHRQFRSRLFFTSDAKEDTTPGRSNFARKFLEGLRTMRGRDGFFTASELFSNYIEKATPPTHAGDFERDQPGSSFLFFHSGPVIDPEEQRIWDLAQQQNSREALVFYLQLYPEGHFSEEAQKALDQFGSTLVDDTGSKLISDPPSSSNKDLPRDNLILIEGGTFEMGDQFGDGGSDEKPVHSVRLDNFYIGQYEVTVGEYLAFVNATGKNHPQWLEAGNNYNINTGSDDYYKKMGDALTNEDHPIVGISWLNAVVYCNWLSAQNNYQPVYNINGNTVTANWQANGYRLPSEAEWEYAARSGGRKEKWAGTSTESQLVQYANYSGTKDGHSYTAPVGSFSPNSAKLYDMTGNVWEWCWDWYVTDYYAQSKNASNPKGPASGTSRVLRGGSWSYGPAYVRCADRNFLSPGDRGNRVGFRLSRAAY